MTQVAVGDALRTGINRSVKKNGVMLFAAFFLLNLSAATMSFGAERTAANLVFGTVLSVLSIVTLVLSMYVGIIAARVFVSDHTERIPDEITREHVLPAMLHLLIGSILLSIGAVLLFTPAFVMFAMGRVAASIAVAIGTGVVAVYVGLGILFWNFYVIVEDAQAWNGIKQSWSLVAGNRADIFILLLGLVLVSVVIGLPVTALSVPLPSVIRVVLNQAVSAFVSVVSIAVLANVYNQLTA